MSGTTEMNEKSKSRRERTRQLMFSINRSKWEKEMARIKLLENHKPLLPTYLMSEFELRKLTLIQAIHCLYEAGQPDIYDCHDNPVRVKVSILVFSYCFILMELPNIYVQNVCYRRLPLRI